MRFFGIDWLHIFRVSYNLKEGVEAMAKLVINDTSTTAFADILLPRYDDDTRYLLFDGIAHHRQLSLFI